MTRATTNVANILGSAIPHATTRPSRRQGGPPQQRDRTPGPGGLLPHRRCLQAGPAPDAPLPADLEAEFAAAYQTLSQSSGVPDVPVAVRSALDEDGSPPAGQHETELNLVGIDAVFDAVARPGLPLATSGRSPTAGRGWRSKGYGSRCWSSSSFWPIPRQWSSARTRSRGTARRSS